ncbi:MAG: LysR family transcriptional regulator [Bacteroidetes bacterium]|nr:LysR family transcriptional regulator [Bacteroidota bacterium]
MAKSIKDILKKNLGTKVNGSLWLESADGRFLGPGPIELLERIAETGSISAAAKEMKMSYKKAWELINNLNAHLATPAVIPQAGGEKGGGSVLTPEAMELISYHRELRKSFTAFLENESKKLTL